MTARLETPTVFGSAGESKRARRGNTDARARERAGADGDGDAIDLIEAQPRLLHHFADHRDEPLRVPGLEALEHCGELDDNAAAPLGDAGRAAVKAGVEGENVHRA